MEKPSSSLKLAVREDTHMVGKSKLKTKPKIRIVHIFAPEIIKTDVANFRDLVQRLTGKPAKRTAAKKKKTQKMVIDDEVEAPPPPTRGGWVDEGYSDGGLLSVLGEVEGLFQGLTDYPFL